MPWFHVKYSRRKNTIMRIQCAQIQCFGTPCMRGWTFKSYYESRAREIYVSNFVIISGQAMIINASLWQKFSKFSTKNWSPNYSARPQSFHQTTHNECISDFFVVLEQLYLIQRNTNSVNSVSLSPPFSESVYGRTELLFGLSDGSDDIYIRYQ